MNKTINWIWHVSMACLTFSLCYSHLRSCNSTIQRLQKLEAEVEWIDHGLGVSNQAINRIIASIK
jgi:hypothetical protein